MLYVVWCRRSCANAVFHSFALYHMLSVAVDCRKSRRHPDSGYSRNPVARHPDRWAIVRSAAIFHGHHTLRPRQPPPNSAHGPRRFAFSQAKRSKPNCHGTRCDLMPCRRMAGIFGGCRPLGVGRTQRRCCARIPANRCAIASFRLGTIPRGTPIAAIWVFRSPRACTLTFPSARVSRSSSRSFNCPLFLFRSENGMLCLTADYRRLTNASWQSTGSELRDLLSINTCASAIATILIGNCIIRRSQRSPGRAFRRTTSRLCGCRLRPRHSPAGDLTFRPPQRIL